jgi:hypothetical protein
MSNLSIIPNQGCRSLPNMFAQHVLQASSGANKAPGIQDSRRHRDWSTGNVSALPQGGKAFPLAGKDLPEVLSSALLRLASSKPSKVVFQPCPQGSENRLARIVRNLPGLNCK